MLALCSLLYWLMHVDIESKTRTAKRLMYIDLGSKIGKRQIVRNADANQRSDFHHDPFH